LLAIAFALLSQADITTLTHCAYSDSDCSTETYCLDVCADSTTTCSSYSSCHSVESLYTGMSEWADCYVNGGDFYITNCTDDYDSAESSSCSDYDICQVFCTSTNGNCDGSCYYVGYNINIADYNDCDDMEDFYSDSFDDFEGFLTCFNNTVTRLGRTTISFVIWAALHPPALRLLAYLSSRYSLFVGACVTFWSQRKRL